MRDDEGNRWCDNRAAHRRPEKSSHLLFCRVEGHEYDTCEAHWQLWVATLAQHHQLEGHCPNCMHMVLGKPAPTPRPATLPLTGPLADAIDNAMFRAGVLVDARRQALRYLAEVDDIYVSSILRSTQAAAREGSAALWSRTSARTTALSLST